MSPYTVFILTLTITVDPARVEEYLSHLKPVYDAVIKEPDCTSFQVLTNPNVPGEIKTVQGWAKDREWFRDNQATKPYFEPFSTVTTAMWIKPRVVEFHFPRAGFQYQRA